jgi:hypothetical protein
MILFVLACLGGVLTIVSPCTLPVLPFVFARAGRAGEPVWTRRRNPASRTVWSRTSVSPARGAALAALGGFWREPDRNDRGWYGRVGRNRGVLDYVTIDGARPARIRRADGQAAVTAHRLCRLIGQKGKIVDHTFEISFLDPGIQA